MSAVNNKIINGGNQTEIFNYFIDCKVNKDNPQYSSWFDTNELTGYRLYQACTLWGERQNALDTRQKVAERIWWSFADANILPLPKSCSFPSDFAPIKNNMNSDIIDISANENVAIAV